MGKNILKIFGNNDPLLIDPDMEMIGRGGDNASDKASENDRMQPVRA